MCRMYAAISKNVIKREWLDPVQDLAKNGKTRSDMPEPGHHDGWGMVAYFKEGFPEYLDREPHSVTKDMEHFKNGAAAIEEGKSKAAMVHFRKISVGQPQISNTHPFLHKEWSFCHNGTIFDSEKIPLQKLQPGGATDSERFFLFLMERISQNPGEATLKKATEEIQKKFNHTSLTFLLTDGSSLYAYRECEKKYEDYYTLYQAQTAGGTVLSSQPLDSLKVSWKPMENGSLLVFS